MSNRTYQVIAAIRYLANRDYATTEEAVATLFRDMKNTDKGKFGMAYVSPSSLKETLLRLVTEDGLLLREGGQYHLTPKGSVLADLLGHLPVDPNSTEFLTNYKAHVAHAHILYYHSNGRPASATATQVAESTGLSGDSARKGLSELVLEQVVEKVGDTYRLTKLPIMAPPATPTPPRTPVDEVLDSVNEAPVRPFDPPPAPKVEEPVATPEPEAPAPKNECPNHKSLGGIEEPTPEPWGKHEWETVPRGIQQRFVARAEAMGLSLSDYLTLLDADLVIKARQAFLPGIALLDDDFEDDDDCEGCEECENCPGCGDCDGEG